MGSDGTDILSDAPEEPYMGSGTLKLAMRMAHVIAAQPSAEELAAGQIQLCLEEGNESIDLSYVSPRFPLMNQKLIDLGLAA